MNFFSITSLLFLAVVFLTSSAVAGDEVKGSRLNPHHVESGTRLERNRTHIIRHEPKNGVSSVRLGATDHINVPPNPSNGKRSSAPTSASGWVTSGWTWGNNFTFFSAEWTVPTAPTNNPGNNIIFFFNSFQGATPGGSGSDILQPVLQYNQVNAPGWTLAAWYGSGEYTSVTPTPVKEGDTITGVVSLSSTGIWFVGGYANGILVTNLTIAYSDFNHGDFQNTAQWAMEVYNMKTCDMYPPENYIALTNIFIQDQFKPYTPSWGSFSPNVQACNASGIVYSPSSLALTWVSGTTTFGQKVASSTVGVDIAGSDLTTISNIGTAVACAQQCDQNSQCQGWSWDSCGKSSCWLKSSVGTRSTNNCRVSSVKVGQVGVDRSGYDLAQINLPVGTATAATCAAYCNGNAACTSWSFDTCGKSSCWLKANVGTTSSNSCRTSGVKGTLYLDHKGGDLSSSTLANNADATQCQNKCDATSGCTGWSYVNGAPGCESTNTCWLKSGSTATTTAPTINPCRISGGAHV